MSSIKLYLNDISLGCLFLFIVGLHKVGAKEKYFVIEENHRRYKVKNYVLNTDSLYGISKKVELFNILPNPIFNQDEQNLWLFSVLPDLSSNEDWQEVALDSISNDTLSFSEMQNLASKSLYDRFDYNYIEKTKYLNEYKLVIKRRDKYFVSKNCLLQFYAIRNRSDYFNSLFGTINISQRKISIKEFKNIFNITYPTAGFPLDGYLDTYSIMDKLRDRKEFLSKEFVLKSGHKAYQFWTYLDWSGPITKSNNGFEFYREERGIDRFIFVPNLGIIGGSFDFYFWRNRKLIKLDIQKFADNIYDEKVMMASAFN